MVSYLQKILPVAMLLGFFSSFAQTIDKKNLVQMDPIVCYASGLVEKSSIPPPEAYLKRLKSGNDKTANIIVDYIGFSQEAKASFQAAVEIWEYLIDSDIPIYIQATWSSSLDDNVLGSCGATYFGHNFEGALQKDTYYPIALVEKLLREEVTNESDPDMAARFNSKINWYYGTDGNPPFNKYDLISTVLHEIGHGLGFIGFMDKNGLVGSYDGFGDHEPTSFDRYIATGTGQKLTDTNTFPNPSSELGNQLTSNSLWFYSPVFVNSASNPKPRLYAPFTWNDGSSVYHLNDATYPSGTINSLMTHAAGMGESILDPGPITLGILADIGWKSIQITHENVKDIETIPETRKIEAEIHSDYPLDSAAIFLYYSKDAFSTYDSSLFTINKSTNKFEALMPLSSGISKINYYISARDDKDRTFTKPSFAPEDSYEFSIGPDNSFPTITHEKIPYFLLGSNTHIVADADDNLGIDTIYVEHFLNGVQQPSFGLTKQKGTKYVGNFHFSGPGPVDGDTINYRLVAIDASSSKNTTFLPVRKPFETRVEQVFEPVNKFSSDLLVEKREFISSDFTVGHISGFDNDALHSPHPYPEAVEAGLSFNFTAILKYPIIIVDGGSFSYDEVVLVEPGADLNSYGDPDFWDYVIVEGSKDMGNNWLPIIDGYDSGENTLWENAYNQNMNGDNSTTVGTKDLFIPKNIVLTENENFVAGDTILIRFRLFSDQMAAGWGWAIDNIRIQIPTANEAVPSEIVQNAYLYPNPLKDELNVSIVTYKPLNQFSCDIYNSYGQLVLTKNQSAFGNNFSDKIDVSGLTSGMYVVKLTVNGQIIETKKVMKK